MLSKLFRHCLMCLSAVGLTNSGVLAQTVRPADYGNVVLHLTAETLALGDAAPVTSWGPMSSAGTAAPTFVASDPRFNGKAVVRFDGTSDYMTWSEADLNARTVVAAVVLDAGAPANAALVSNGGNDIFVRRNASTLAYRSPGKALEPYDFVGGIPAGTLTVNGVASGTFTAGTAHLVVATAGRGRNFSALWLGNPGTTSGGYWRGAVAEMVVYDGVLSEDGLAAVGWYLQNKYGLPATFPAPKPMVRSFTIAQGVLASRTGLLSAAGEPFTLGWQVENADTVAIDRGVLAAGGTAAGTAVATAAATTTYTLTATNAQGSVTAAVTVHVGAAALPVRMNEFMAENDSTLEDEDGDASDWIELHNPNPFAIDLGGLRLRDSSDQWDFPAGAAVEAGGYRVVFASAKNRNHPAGPLHTNFALNRAGEYLGLWRIGDGTAIQEFAPAFPVQGEDRSYGLWGDPPQLGYFGAPMSQPSPGAPNAATGAIGFLDDLDAAAFAVGRGHFTDPVRETLTASTAGARLIYTTNGSTPTETNGTGVLATDAATPPKLELTIFPGAVPDGVTGATVPSIGGTTTLRAAVFKDGFAPTRVETHTYIFPAVVARQSVADARSRGWPASSVNGQVFKYGMNAAAVNAYTDEAVVSSLHSLPVVSLVTDQTHFTAPTTGVYVNADQHGPAWERPVSVEMFFPPGWTEAWGRPSPFHINAGLRIRGGYSRNDDFQKHGLRLYFSGKYEGKLREPIYGPEGARSFGKLELAIGSNYGWFRESSFSNGRFNTMCRDPFARDTQGALGQPHTRTRYVHLYLNGVYWGVHYVEERAEADFASSYFGGRSGDYDVVKCGNHVGGFQTEVTDGDLAAWRTLWQKVRAIGTADASNEKYFELEGRDAAGVRVPAMPVWLDIDNLIDEMAVIFFTGDGDAVLSNFLSRNQPNNWWGSRQRNGDRGFRFFIRDAEHTLGAPSSVVDQTGPWTGSNQNNFSFSNPQWMHQDLMKNAEYKLRFADRVHRHFFNGGPLTREQTVARFRRRAAQVENAMMAESVRWGNTRSISGLPAGHPPYYTVDDWRAATNSVVNTTLPNRATIVLNQLRATRNGLYPATVAPTFIDDRDGSPRHGGPVDHGFALRLTAPAGTIYYTLDGSDPRVIGGAVAPSARTYESPVVLAGTARVRTRVLTGAAWSALNDASFTVGGVPASSDNLVLSEIHYHPADPGHTEFLEFLNIGSATIDLTGVSLTDGVLYAFPDNTRLAPGGRLIVAGSLSDFTARYPGAPGPVLGPFSGALNNAGEEITVTSALTGTIRQFAYGDQSPWPLAADGTGPSLVLARPETNPDHSDAAQWTASPQPGGSPGLNEFGTGGFTGTDPQADADGDGLGAFLEHALGTSDTNPAQGPDSLSAAVLPFSPDGVPAEYLTVTFAKPAASTLAYTVETSRTLTLWYSGASHVVLAHESPGPNNSIIQTWRSTQPHSNDSPQYIRLRVWVP